LSAGANKFLVASYPDLAIMPQQIFNNQSVNEIYHNYSVQYRDELARLAEDHDEVAYADVFSLFQKFVQDPERFGFDPSVVGKACLTGAYNPTVPRTLCNDPDKYVFWDDYHVRTISLYVFPGANCRLLHYSLLKNHTK
jgi:phospholipase/lecithinase/hemolysin